MVDEIIICISSSEVSDELSAAGKFCCQSLNGLSKCFIGMVPRFILYFDLFKFRLDTQSHLLANKSHSSFSGLSLEK